MTSAILSKRISTTILAAFIATVGFAGPGVLQKAWLKGTTDKAPIFYKPGETMVFTIEPQGIDGEIPAGTYFLDWERSGDDGVTEKGIQTLKRHAAKK